MDELRKLDLNNLTPLAAMQLLQRWQEGIERDDQRTRNH